MKRNLLDEQRAMNIASSIVQVGHSSMRMYRAAPNLFPEVKLSGPEYHIMREPMVWDRVAPRDPDRGFIPSHKITDREMDSYRVLVKE